MVKKIKNKNEILKVFVDLISWKTIKEVSKEIGLSYQPTYVYLAELKGEGFLNHKIEGGVHFYSLNLKNNRLVREVENIEFERAQIIIEGFDKKVRVAFDELFEYLYRDLSVKTVLLFGSTARKTRIKKSDIDVLIVALGDGNEIKRICNTINIKYNIRISPVVVSLKEFRKMMIERNDFTKNLIKDKVVLRGFEFYFYELIKSMEQLKWI